MAGPSCTFKDVAVEDLEQIRHFVEKTATTLGSNPETTGEMVVAVNEAVTNIFQHGYQSLPGEIEVAVEYTDSALLVTLRDQAPPFNPTTVPPPDTTLPLAQRPFGGMGIHMMRAFCDELRYRRLPDGGNELVLVKGDDILF